VQDGRVGEVDGGEHDCREGGCRGGEGGCATAEPAGFQDRAAGAVRAAGAPGAPKIAQAAPDRTDVPIPAGSLVVRSGPVLNPR